MSLGILHPGAMGASIGAVLVASGHEVAWASEGRTEATRARAAASGLTDIETLDALVDQCDTIVSVCPPGEAHAVASNVAALRFGGLYVDANAIAPATARAVAAEVRAGGGSFLDGGIIGPPVKHEGLTVLYLAGERTLSDGFAGAFTDSVLETHHVSNDVGAASAVKMAFAAWTKGTSALLLAARALAEAEGVTDGLDHAWSVLTPDLAERLPATALGTAPKAWRFVAEMREIAASFENVGLPSGFHEAAAEIYESLADLKDQRDLDVGDVIERLIRD